MTTTTHSTQDELDFAFQLGVWITLSTEAHQHYRDTGTLELVFMQTAQFVEDDADGPRPPTPSTRVTFTYPAEMFDAALAAQR